MLNLKNNILCQIYFELEAQKTNIFYYHQTINTLVVLSSTNKKYIWIKIVGVFSWNLIFISNKMFFLLSINITLFVITICMALEHVE